MLRTSCLFLASVLLTACASYTAKNVGADPLFLDVVSSQKAFDGKTVTFNAWITLRHEDRNLWATWKDHENWETRQCISLTNYDALNGLEASLDGQYVRITGVIRSDASDNGKVIRLGSCQKMALEITDANSIEVLKPN